MKWTGALPKAGICEEKIPASAERSHRPDPLEPKISVACLQFVHEPPPVLQYTVESHFIFFSNEVHKNALADAMSHLQYARSMIKTILVDLSVPLCENSFLILPQNV